MSFPDARVSILFEFNIKIFKFGKYPSILVDWNKFAERLSSVKFGKLGWVKTSSKSRNLQFDKSSSVISLAVYPYNLDIKISSVNLPVNKSFASYYSLASMEIPSSTY